MTYMYRFDVNLVTDKWDDDSGSMVSLDRPEFRILLMHEDDGWMMASTGAISQNDAHDMLWQLILEATAAISAVNHGEEYHSPFASTVESS